MFTSGVLRAARTRSRLLARARLHPRRVLTVPTVAAVEPAAHGRARVRVDGMVCALCAARTSAAFGRVEGVRDVRVDLDAGIAELSFDAEPGAAAAPSRDALQRSLDAVVVGGVARRLLARIAARFAPRREGAR